MTYFEETTNIYRLTCFHGWLIQENRNLFDEVYRFDVSTKTNRCVRKKYDLSIYCCWIVDCHGFLWFNTGDFETKCTSRTFFRSNWFRWKRRTWTRNRFDFEFFVWNSNLPMSSMSSLWWRLARRCAARAAISCVCFLNRILLFFISAGDESPGESFGGDVACSFRLDKSPFWLLDEWMGTSTLSELMLTIEFPLVSCCLWAWSKLKWA